MEIKKFKQWLIENEYEEDELFVQSIKCFQIEAYKAAYLYSYLALINYIKEIIIGYHGIPIPFLEKIKGKTDNDKKAIWKKKINDLNLDDKWEENTWNFINEGKETNIFKLTDSVRVEFSQKKNLRNSCVHNKKRDVSSATVEDLWDFITYVKPLLVINGTVEMLINKFKKIIKFTDQKDYEEEIDIFYKQYILLQYDDRKEVFVSIINYLEECIHTNDYEGMECIDVLMAKVFQKNNANEYDWINNIYIEIYLFVNLDSFELKYSKEDLQEYVFLNKNHFLSIVIPLGKYKKNDELLKKIFSNKQFSEWWEIFTTIAGSEETFEMSEDIMDMIINSNKIDDILEQMEKQLYYYVTSWGSVKQCDTFDYRKFNKYRGYVKIILMMIKCGKLSNIKTDELVERCKEILNLDYSVESTRNNYLDICNFLKGCPGIYE